MSPVIIYELKTSEGTGIVSFGDICNISWFNSRVVGCCDGRGLTSRAGASYNLDDSRARADCACSLCGWGLFGHFYSPLAFLPFFSLSLGDGPI